MGYNFATGQWEPDAYTGLTDPVQPIDWNPYPVADPLAPYYDDTQWQNWIQSLSPDQNWDSIMAGSGTDFIPQLDSGGTDWTKLLAPLTTSSAISTGAGLLGSYLNQTAATDAAEQYAKAQLAASQLAAEAAKFKPVGVTTNFGQSKFGYDAAGNLTSAGYDLSPEMKAQQAALLGSSRGLLTQFSNAPEATAPMGAAAQQAMALGRSYLGTTPQAQAQKYYNEQMALLRPTRERDYADLESRLMAQGRLGLATGGTSTLGASNPEMEALFNAQRMQDLQLAAQSTQGGMDYAKFGAGMVGTGGDLLGGMYRTQTGAFAPYQTALGGATTIEGLGQQAMDTGTAIGAKTSTANANVGSLLGQGMISSAATMQPYNAYSPWGGLLSGLSGGMQQYQQQQQLNPMAGTGYNY